MNYFLYSQTFNRRAGLSSFSPYKNPPHFFHVGDLLFAADGDDHEPYIVPFVTAGYEDHQVILFF